MNTKAKHTVAVIVAALIAFGPDIMEALGEIQHAPKWLALLTKAIGVAVALLSNPKAVLILGNLLGEPIAPTAPQPPRDKQAGKVVDPALLLLIMSCVLVACAFLAKLAHAAPSPQAIGCVDAAGEYCVVPATAVGWQLNLKTGGTQNGVLLAGLALQHEFGTLPVAVGLYGGLGKSTENAGSYQACLGISVTSWGLVCAGTQRVTYTGGGHDWQGMLTFAAQLTYGGSPSYLREQAAPTAGKLSTSDF